MERGQRGEPAACPPLHHIAVKAAAKPGRSGPDEMTLRESAFGESEAVLGPVG